MDKRIKKNRKVSKKETILHDAIVEGDIETVKILLPHIDPNAVIDSNIFHDQIPPIFLALITNKYDIVKIILDDPRLKLEPKESVKLLHTFFLGATTQKLGKDMGKLILNHTKIDSTNSLHLLMDIKPIATEQKEVQTKIAKFLIDEGFFDINNVHDKAGHPLVRAAIRDHIGMVNMFLNHKDFDLDLVDRSQKKPTHSYCRTDECKNLFRKYRLKSIIKKQPKIPNIPANIWRKIIQRKIQTRLCSDLEDEANKEQLLILAEVEYGVPEDVISEWRLKSKRELCRIISGLITVGIMYSPDSMKQLERMFESQNILGLLEQFQNRLENLGIKMHDKYGNAKSIEDLVQELGKLQVVYSDTY